MNISDFYTTPLKFPTADQIREFSDKCRNVYEEEAAKFRKVEDAYKRAATLDCKDADLADANKKAQELLVTAGFVATMAIPGAIFALPVLTKAADILNVKFVPESVKKEFGI